MSEHQQPPPADAPDGAVYAAQIFFDPKSGGFMHHAAAGIPLPGLIAHLALMQSMALDMQKMQIAQAMQQRQALEPKIIVPNGQHGPKPRF